MKTILKALSVCLVAVMLAGCGPQKPEQMTQDQTLVVGTLNFDGKFSPFFYTNAYENDVLGLVNTTLLGTDREGSVVLRGIEGEVRTYNGNAYTYNL